MRRIFVWLAIAAILPGAVMAHVLDEYLQASQLSFAADGVTVELRMIPGVEVSDKVFAVIDNNADGQISSAEEKTYLDRVLNDIEIEIDGSRVSFAITGFAFPSRAELKSGEGTIRIDLAATCDLRPTGVHRITFRNNHLSDISIYQVNPLVPADDAITITKQDRDDRQRILNVELRTNYTGPAGWPTWAIALIGGLSAVFLLVLLFAEWKNTPGHGHDKIVL